jgi:hypothetical protein
MPNLVKCQSCFAVVNEDALLVFAHEDHHDVTLEDDEPSGLECPRCCYRQSMPDWQANVFATEPYKLRRRFESKKSRQMRLFVE